MRYVVDPKKRRNASSFIYTQVFNRMQSRKDITIGSETMDLSVHPPGEENTQEKQPRKGPPADELARRALSQCKEQDKETARQEEEEDHMPDKKRSAA
jgi:hypothetical protein